MRIGKRPADSTNGAHKNGSDQSMRSSRYPKLVGRKIGENSAKKKWKLSRKTRAREDPEHARVVRHKIKGRDVERGLTFTLADARPVRKRVAYDEQETRVYF